MTAGKVHALNAALLGGLFGGSAAAFQRLPAEIPAHFRWSGHVDAWSEASEASWFAVPLLATACGLGIYLLSLVARRRPGLYNLPRKADFLALSAERRQQVLRMLEVFLAWLGVAVTIEAAAVQLSVFSAASGRADRLSLGTVLALIVGTAALGIAGGLFFQRLDERIRVLSKEEHAARSRP